MRTATKVAVTMVCALIIGTGLSGAVLADSAPVAEAKAELDEAKLLRGELWKRLGRDEKLAYLWGVFTVVEVERQLMAAEPSLTVENFSAKAAEAEQGKTLEELMEIIDGFYQENPDKEDLSVIRVVWDVTIVPNITTGIAGEPLDAE